MVQFFTTDVKMRFYLKSPKSKTPSKIEMKVCYKGTTTKIICKDIKVLPSLWSQSHQRAFVSNILSDLDNHNNTIVNNIISDYENKFNEFLDFISANPKFAVTLHLELKKHFNMGRKPIHKLYERPFDIYKWLIDSITNDNNIKDSVKGNYKRGVKHFQEFNNYRQAQGYDAITEYAQIKSTIIDEFTDYLCEEATDPKTGDYYAIVTVEGKIKCFMATFHKYAHKSGKITKEETKLVSYALPQAKDGKSSYHIALRDDEVLQLWRYNCENKFDEEIKDMFLMLCLVGVRVGDINQISENLQTINGEKRLTIHQQKTQQMLGDGSIGIIFELANDILQKYNDNLPQMNAKKINENINRIARSAGVGTNEVVHIARQYCNEAEKRIEIKDKCDMIKTHTGRRTFATILAHHRWQNADIMLYTGHKKEDTFKKYCKKTTETQSIFDKIRKERPHDILQITEAYRQYGREEDPQQPQVIVIQQPQQQIAPITIPQPQLKDGDPTDIGEAIAVLHMLNANPDDYIGVTDFKALLRQVAKQENEIKRIFGGGRYEFKAIFNDYELPTIRQQALHELLKALEQQKED